MKNFYLGLVKKMIKVIQLVIIRIKIMIKKEKDRIMNLWNPSIINKINKWIATHIYVIKLN
jgi:hypothetical protein